MRCSVSHYIAALALAALALSSGALLAQTPPPNALNFQGRLAKPDATPVPDGTYNLRLRFYDAATAGTTLYDQSLVNVPVKNGTFAVRIEGFTADKFNGNAWLGISINGGADLAPRTQIVSVPYALKATLALSVPNGSLTNAKIAPGTLTADRFASGVLNTTAWLLGGNSGVTSGFLGTTDNTPLEFRVNGHRGMRYQYAADSANQYRSINVLGGSEANRMDPDVVGATIAGGGLDYFTGTDYPNSVTGGFGTVGGGYSNTASSLATVGGGTTNTASGLSSTVAGGSANNASFDYATIGGGFTNTANRYASTVAGGYTNTANGYASTIGGGYGNTANGYASTVAGGNINTASGSYSFAAGNRAQALHDGTFVWNDSSSSAFASTAPDQFLIRASGGVGINTNTPGFPLSFPNTLGDKISLWGQSGDHFGLGIATGTLQIYSRDAGTNIDMGYGSSANFHLTARSYGNGDFYAVGNSLAAHFYQSSDARYKHNVQTLADPLETLMRLRGVSFAWNKEKGGGHDLGFLAQEVETVLPELVHTDKDGYKSVAYANVVPLAVEAIKTIHVRTVFQQKTIAALRSDNAFLRLDNAAQQKQIDTLRGENAAMQATLAAVLKRLDALEAQKAPR